MAAVIRVDTTDIEVAFEILNGPFNPTGSTLTATLVPVNGGEPLGAVTSVDGGLRFVAGNDGKQYLLLTVKAGTLDAFRPRWNGLPLGIVGDVIRTLEGSDRVEPFGRISFTLVPASNSALLTAGGFAAQAPVLVPGQLVNASLGPPLNLPALQGPVSSTITEALTRIVTASANMATRQIQIYADQVRDA